MYIYVTMGQMCCGTNEQVPPAVIVSNWLRVYSVNLYMCPPKSINFSSEGDSPEFIRVQEKHTADSNSIAAVNPPIYKWVRDTHDLRVTQSIFNQKTTSHTLTLQQTDPH